eukprot:m.39665 g.39665  ORF g.39665 m.39665 type:complete len:101 (-) comp10300_c0_seq2:73-375(-)
MSVSVGASPKLSWSKSRMWKGYLALGCRNGEHGLSIYKYDGSKRELKYIRGVSGGSVTDVSFAPSMGRSFLFLAASYEDGYVRIFKLKKCSVENALNVCH